MVELGSSHRLTENVQCSDERIVLVVSPISHGHAVLPSQ